MADLSLVFFLVALRLEFSPLRRTRFFGFALFDTLAFALVDDFGDFPVFLFMGINGLLLKILDYRTSLKILFEPAYI